MRTALLLLLLSLSVPRAGVAHAEDRELQPVAPYVGVGWRVLGLADHVSHGPDYQVGVILYEHLRIGIAGFARPGPINGKTFTLDLPDGETYKGQSSLSLRSDGSVVGLQLSPILRLPAKTRLEIELPIIVGFGGFGFYLTGDDRNTPDGRRVSEWEGELMDDRDASLGLAIDVGIRIGIRVYKQWLRVYLGAHYTAIPGYDAFITSDYSGFSGVAGLELRGVRDQR
jgi:hypothetical protein